MSATWSASKRPASFAGCSRMQRMPSSMQTTCVATPASTSITETGVSTPVSLFALVPALGSLLLVVVVLLSLALSGLTGLACLVGLTKVPVPHTKQGD
jgi:hypothetical protein